MNVNDLVPKNDPHLMMELKVSELTSEFLSLATSKQPPMTVTTEKVAQIRDDIHRAVNQMVTEGIILDTIKVADIILDSSNRCTIRFIGGTANGEIPSSLKYD